MTHPSPDGLDDIDRSQINRIINDMNQTYQEQVDQALSDVHEAKRAMNRAEHKLRRLEKHKARIEAFCKQYNVKLEN